jgi:hypothetical protein
MYLFPVSRLQCSFVLDTRTQNLLPPGYSRPVPPPGKQLQQKYSHALQTTKCADVKFFGKMRILIMFKFQTRITETTENTNRIISGARSGSVGSNMFLDLPDQDPTVIK